MSDQLYSDLKKHNQSNTYYEPIAIVGLGALFPNGNGLRNFWQTILNGVDTITDIPTSHWSVADYYSPNPKAEDKTYGQKGAFLSPTNFNPLKYGIPPKDLSAIDSTQLLGLVAASEALNNAGYGENNKDYNHSRTSVILGVTGALKLTVSLGSRLAHPQIRKSLAESGVSDEIAQEVIERYLNHFPKWQENSFPGLLGNVSAGRISNRLNLGGSNMVVDAACGSSLAAIRQAVLELQTNRSDMVVSGGLDTFSDYFMYTCFSKTPALSPSGDIRAYDSNGDGTMLGEGLGVVILKRLTSAQKDGDRIYAVIKSIGASSDGKGTAIFAPTTKGQEKAIATCYQEAEINPSTIELIEGHGTGTAVGDAVEIKALQNIYNKNREKPYPWAALGSVKSQIGHTKAAAGVAGLIKSALALYHKVLPPTIKITKPNEALNIKNSPLYLNTQASAWLENNNHPRRAAVSAFGFGGSNFHCLMEEYQNFKPRQEVDFDEFLIPLSADNIIDLVKELVLLIETQNTKQAENIAREKQKNFNYRQSHKLIIVAENFQHLKKLLLEVKDLLAEKQLTNKIKNNWPNGVYFTNKKEQNKLGFIFASKNSFSSELLNYFSLNSPIFLNALSSFNLLKEHSLNHLLFTPNFLYKSYLSKLNNFKESKIGKSLKALAINYSLSKLMAKFAVKSNFTAGEGLGKLSALLCGNWLNTEHVFNYLQSNKLNEKHFQNGTEIILNGQAINNKEELFRNINLENNFEQTASFCKKQKNTCFLELGSHGNFSPLLEDKIISFPENKPALYSLASVLARLTVLGFSVDYTNWPQKYFAEDIKEEFSVKISGANYFERKETIKPRMQNKNNKNKTDNKDNNKDNNTESILLLIEKISADTSKMHQDFLKTQNNTLNLLQNLVLAKTTSIEPPNFNSIVTETQESKKFNLAEIETPPTPYYEAIKTEALKTPKVETKNLNLKNILLKVLAQETGYPEDMLKLDMDLENDLGLDSIKRVEVMAALAEKLPETESLETADLESALTINNLLNLIEKNVSTSPANNYPVEEISKRPKNSETKDENVWETIKKIVAQETGYPEEMLNEEMNLTNDLGLDSIKRVEIMAALAEELPQAAEISAEALTEESSLKDLLNALNAGSNIKQTITTVAVNKSPQSLQINKNTVLYETISQETGYPPELLKPEMSLEDDLGLDSIKRVEIMATLTEKLPQLAQLSSESLNSSLTIKDIEILLEDNNCTLSQEPKSTETLEKTKNLKDILLKVVSHETGYPPELLKPEMSLEDDLGLDSIKRVEIMAALTEEIGEQNSQNLNNETLESLNTLDDLLKAINYKTETETEDSKKKTSRPTSVSKPNLEVPTKVEDLILLEPNVEDYNIDSLKNRTEKLGNIWLITNFDSELEKKLFKRFKKNKSDIESIPWDVDLTKALELLKSPDTVIFSWPKIKPKNQYKAFEFLKFLSEKEKTPKLIAGLSSLGGNFAFKPTKADNINPLSANLVGVLKSAALEWQNTTFKIIDLPYSLQKENKTPDINKKINNILEILNKETSIEVGISANNNIQKISLKTYRPKKQETKLFNKNDVVLVTGGARGITAEAIINLSKNYNLHFIIFGRTPIGPPEPNWLKELKTDAEIKNALFEMAPTHQKLSPKELSIQSKFIQNTREIKETISKLENNNSQVTYFECDLNDSPNLSKNLKTIKDKFGEIAGFIHGAGVLADKLIKDKLVSDFEDVFNTKVKIALTILKTFKESNLKLLAFFSSSTARFGRIGQSDYAAANEVLNKIAQKYALQNKHTKVISFNWGPWDGGMVEKNLAKVFKSEGIGLIPLQSGAQLFTKIVNQKVKEPVEIVVLGPETDIAKL